MMWANLDLHAGSNNGSVVVGIANRDVYGDVALDGVFRASPSECAEYCRSLQRCNTWAFCANLDGCARGYAFGSGDVTLDKGRYRTCLASYSSLPGGYPKVLNSPDQPVRHCRTHARAQAWAAEACSTCR